MQSQTTPGPVKGRESLSKLGSNDNNKNPKNFNHLKTLEELSNKWVLKGFYSTSSRALDALIRGVL
jgi:hypothetical protein